MLTASGFPFSMFPLNQIQAIWVEQSVEWPWGYKMAGEARLRRATP